MLNKFAGTGIFYWSDPDPAKLMNCVKNNILFHELKAGGTLSTEGVRAVQWLGIMITKIFFTCLYTDNRMKIISKG